jgi:hypothetical protein
MFWSLSEMTAGQSATLSWCLAPLCDPWPDFAFLLFDTYFLLHIWRPLWREDGAVVCSALTQWSQSRRSPNDTLLSHLSLPQLAGPGPRIYISHEQDGPVIPREQGSLFVATNDSQGYGGVMLTCFHTELIVLLRQTRLLFHYVWHPVTSWDIPSDNGFCFQGNIIKGSPRWDSV